MDLQEIKTRIDKLKTERTKISEKMERLNNSIQKSKERLAKETAKYQTISEKIERLEGNLYKKKLREVGLDEETGLEEILKVYKEHAGVKYYEGTGGEEDEN